MNSKNNMDLIFSLGVFLVGLIMLIVSFFIPSCFYELYLFFRIAGGILLFSGTFAMIIPISRLIISASLEKEIESQGIPLITERAKLREIQKFHQDLVKISEEQKEKVLR